MSPEPSSHKAVGDIRVVASKGACGSAGAAAKGVASTLTLGTGGSVEVIGGLAR